jgi:hypothetical protein
MSELTTEENHHIFSLQGLLQSPRLPPVSPSKSDHRRFTFDMNAVAPICKNFPHAHLSFSDAFGPQILPLHCYFPSGV